MTPCDEWEGPTNNSGYGYVCVGGQVIGAHRLVWMQDHGHLETHEFVCHKCDNKLCINIDHLFVGSQSDNMQDMIAKGFHPRLIKTHCPRGHVYEGDNLYIHPTSGARYCKTCKAKATAESRKRKQYA